MEKAISIKRKVGCGMRKFNWWSRLKESVIENYLNVKRAKYMKAIRWLRRKLRKWYERLDSKHMKSYIASKKLTIGRKMSIRLQDYKRKI